MIKTTTRTDIGKKKKEQTLGDNPYDTYCSSEEGDTQEKKTVMNYKEKLL